MSDKEFVLDAIQRLPARTSFSEIRTRIDFLAALKEAEASLDRGEGIPHAEVKKQFASWSKKWRSKSTGHRKQLTTSAA